VTKILAALLERDRTGKGGHVVVSMTHGSTGSSRTVSAATAVPRMLTGGLASYRIYQTADGRHLTVAPLEPVFFRRLTELLGRPELAERQFDADQEALAAELAAIFAARPLAEWLELFDAEDVCVGPVATIAEAAADLA
jgi:Predicted acyl-CoA transferases/carnitine dehydratase